MRLSFPAAWILSLTLLATASGAEPTVSVDRAIAYPLWLPPPGPAAARSRTFAARAETDRAEIVARAQAMARARFASPLATAALSRLPEATEYSLIELFYQEHLRTGGRRWLESPEGQQVVAVKNDLEGAVLSAAVVTTDGKKEIVYTQGGRRYVIDGFSPDQVEQDTPERHTVSAMIVRMVVGELTDHSEVKAVLELIRKADRENGVVLDVATQRGMTAAGRGDWVEAVTAFRQAASVASATPSTMFNLGLAYQRRGWPIPAAMWYRAYLAAAPEAPNAAAVRTEVDKLLATIRINATRLLDEGERLAGALSSAPLSAGGKSPRQASLETSGRYAYLAGLEERGARLMQQARSLPDARPLDEIPDRHGLYAASQSLDGERVRSIFRQWDKDFTPSFKLRALAYLHQNRYEWDDLKAAFLKGPADATFSDFNFDTPGAIEVMTVNATRRLDLTRGPAGSWIVESLIPNIERALYNGRPAEAATLAQRAREHLARYPDDIWNSPTKVQGVLLLLDALAGERSAVQNRIRALQFNGTASELWDNPSFDGPAWQMLEARISLALATRLPIDEARPLMEELFRKVEDDYSYMKRDNPDTPQFWIRANPLSSFVRTTVANGEAKAPGILDYTISWREGGASVQDRGAYQIYVTAALRFAVATGRLNLACDLAERLDDSAERLHQLNRILLASNLAPEARRRVEQQMMAISSGWRPRDAAQAWDVQRRLNLASRCSTGEVCYTSLEDILAEAEKAGREKPDEAPALLSSDGTLWWIAALGARETL